jgi:TonB family protein
VPVDAVVPAPPPPSAWPIVDIVLIVLAAGIAARASWLTIGAFGLRRLRRSATPLDPIPERVRLAQERVGARAGIYVSSAVTGPITFGLLRPIVLFPPSVATMPPDVQEAIACHELLHVRRRDWLSDVLEEAVRAALWFHPAIWWLIGRVRLTREQVVDQAVIRLTESRERYVEALLAVAVSNSPVAFAPASPFLRRHLLKQRVARILQETTMTTRRLIASLTVSAAALTVAATFAVRSFPLEAQGRAPADNGAPIQLVKGGEHLMHGDTPEYPGRAIEQKAEGDVVVEMTLNDRGEVADARVLSGPEELRKATLEAVLQWHYSPAALRSTVTQATLRFRLPTDVPLKMKVFDERGKLLKDGELLKDVELSGHVFLDVNPSRKLAWAYAASEHAAGPMRELKEAMDDPATTDAQRAEYKVKYEEMKRMTEKLYAEHEAPIDVSAWHEKEKPDFGHKVELKLLDPDDALRETLEGSPRLTQVRTERVSDATAMEVLAQAGVAIGDAITKETAERIEQAARAMDEHFRVEFEKAKDGIVVTIVAH